MWASFVFQLLVNGSKREVLGNLFHDEQVLGKAI